MKHGSTSLRPVLLLIFFGGSFLLHLVWEKLHVVLYTGYRTFDWPLLVNLKASAGDLIFMLVFYLALTLIHRELFWIGKQKSYAHPATWGITLILGFLMATGFELWAVYVDHRWIYKETMPMIPIIRVGLSPILQMIVVPLMTLMLVFLFTKPQKPDLIKKAAPLRALLFIKFKTVKVANDPESI